MFVNEVTNMETNKIETPEIVVKHAYSPRTRVTVDCSGEPSRTKQSFKNECDINKIMAKFQRTGAISHLAAHGARYGDFTSQDFTEAMNTIAQVNTMFEELPSSLRDRFGNEPEAFLDFVQNPDNHDEMVELGLAKPRPPTGPELAPQGAAEPSSEPPPGEGSPS